MKITIYILQVLVLLAAAACNKKSATEPEAKDFLNTLWKLESFEIDGEIIKPPNNQVYTIRFREDGKCFGKNDCNNIGSEYEVGSDNSITIQPIGTTKIYCGKESMDEKYSQALQKAKSYEIDKNKLIISYGNDTKLEFIGE